MTEPVGYRILLNLQETLEGISKSAGYHFTVAAGAVSVDPLDAVEIIVGRATESPFFVIEAGVGGRPTYQPSNQLIEVLPANINAFANAEAQRDMVARVKTYERLCADIEKAVVVDITRGGLAGDTRIVSKQMNVTSGSLRVVAVVQLEMRLRRFYGSPNG